MTRFKLILLAGLSVAVCHGCASKAPRDLASGGVALSDKPIAYNFVITPVGPTDRLISEHFEKIYSIVNINIGDKNTYQNTRLVTEPKGVKGLGPLESIHIGNRCVPGNVLVAYVIEGDGTVTSLSVLKSTEPLLNDFALQHVSGFVFQPAEVESKKVALVTASWLASKCAVNGQPNE